MESNFYSLFCGCGSINVCGLEGNITHREDFKPITRKGESLFVLHSAENSIRAIMQIICKAAAKEAAFRFNIPPLNGNSVIAFAARPLEPMEESGSEQKPQNAQIINETLEEGQPLEKVLSAIEATIKKNKASIILIDNLCNYIADSRALYIAEGITRIAKENDITIIAGLSVSDVEQQPGELEEFYNSYYRQTARIIEAEEGETHYFILDYPRIANEQIVFGADPVGIPYSLPGLSERLLMKMALPNLAPEPITGPTLSNRLFGFFKGSKSIKTAENYMHKAATYKGLKKIGKGAHMKYQYSDSLLPYTETKKETQPNVITALTNAKIQGKKKRVPFISSKETKILVYSDNYEYGYCIVNEMAISIIEAVICGRALDFRCSFTDPHILAYCLDEDSLDLLEEKIEAIGAKDKIKISCHYDPISAEGLYNEIAEDAKNTKPSMICIFGLYNLTDVQGTRRNIYEHLEDFSKETGIPCIATDTMVNTAQYYYRTHTETVCFVHYLLEDIRTRGKVCDVVELSAQTDGNYISCKALNYDFMQPLQHGEMEAAYLDKTFCRYEGKGILRKNIRDVFGNSVDRKTMGRAKELGIIEKRGYYYYYVPHDRR